MSNLPRTNNTDDYGLVSRLHQRRRRLSQNAQEEPSSSILPTTSISTARTAKRNDPRKRYYFISKKKRIWFGIAAILSITIAVVIIYNYCIEEYAWVRRRCLYSLLWYDNTARAVVCVEARTHQRAMQEPSLWPDTTKYSYYSPKENVLDDSHSHPAATVVSHVHYTITSPLTGESFALALCSMEGMSRYCQEQDERCIINLWIVHEAAAVYDNNGSSSDGSTWLQEMQETLGDAPYCIRIVPASNSTTNNPDDDILLGTACFPPKQPCRALRTWLSSPLARTNQLVAHVSDAWRLVSLAEFGGLYLDADVLALTSELLYLPAPTIPSQHEAAAAYRLNGGFLRLDTVPNVCDDAVSLITVTGKQQPPKYLLQALVADHLYWAPRLATLPLERQTYGFLGPCALTRVYLDQLPQQENITVLPPDMGQPTISALTVCHHATPPLVLHFTGRTLKKSWRSIVSNSECIQKKVEGICPKTLQRGKKRWAS
jgi:hypothetical protein